MNGKGSKQRPSSVRRAKFVENWNRIFNDTIDYWEHECDEQDGETILLKMGLQCPQCGVSYER